MKNNPVLQYDNKGDRHGPESAEHDCVFDADPQDVEIMERLHNVYPESRRASSDNSVKKKLMDDICDAGIRMRNDTEFHAMISYFFNSYLGYRLHIDLTHQQLI